MIKQGEEEARRKFQLENLDRKRDQLGTLINNI